MRIHPGQGIAGIRAARLDRRARTGRHLPRFDPGVFDSRRRAGMRGYGATGENRSGEKQKGMRQAGAIGHRTSSMSEKSSGSYRSHAHSSVGNCLTTGANERQTAMLDVDSSPSAITHRPWFGRVRSAHCKKIFPTKNPFQTLWSVTRDIPGGNAGDQLQEPRAGLLSSRGLLFWKSCPATSRFSLHSQ